MVEVIPHRASCSCFSPTTTSPTLHNMGVEETSKSVKLTHVSVSVYLPA